MVKEGIIRPSTSPWCAPAVYVPKSSGEIRICVDFVQRNKVTKKTHTLYHDQKDHNRNWLAKKSFLNLTWKVHTGSSQWRHIQSRRLPFAQDLAMASGSLQ